MTYSLYHINNYTITISSCLTLQYLQIPQHPILDMISFVDFVKSVKFFVCTVQNGDLLINFRISKRLKLKTTPHCFTHFRNSLESLCTKTAHLRKILVFSCDYAVQFVSCPLTFCPVDVATCLSTSVVAEEDGSICQAWHASRGSKREPAGWSGRRVFRAVRPGVVRRKATGCVPRCDALRCALVSPAPMLLFR